MLSSPLSLDLPNSPFLSGCPSKIFYTLIFPLHVTHALPLQLRYFMTRKIFVEEYQL